MLLTPLSLIPHAITHALLPPLPLSFLFPIPIFIPPLITPIIPTIFIPFITKNTKTKPHAPIRITFTAFLPTRLILISFI
ncbi:metal ABC transporter permease, partial [Staphylococcus saprophyticus]|uniref:metal ABC transporter permease n=1 Tax=Staphylococcus saprophyticus TaxID=29385 RepID=UPI0021B495F9